MEKLSAVCTSILVLVFGYTALSKLADLHSFRLVLTQVPVVQTGAAALSVLLPLAELAVVLLLLFPRTRARGLWASVGLLSLFTVYLVWMLVFAPGLPCACGGVISGMGWWAHVGLNAGLIGLAGCGIRCCKQVSQAGI